MASDGQPVKIPAVSLVHGSQAPTVAVQHGGNLLPPSGKPAAPKAAPTLQAQVQLLNKYLNDSGKPDQFRVDPNSDGKLIQQVNPANGEVVGEFPQASSLRWRAASAFLALSSISAPDPPRFA